MVGGKVSISSGLNLISSLAGILSFPVETLDFRLFIGSIFMFLNGKSMRIFATLLSSLTKEYMIRKIIYANMENLVLRARSETEGSASEFCDKIPSGDNQSRVLRARIFTLKVMSKVV